MQWLGLDGRPRLRQGHHPHPPARHSQADALRPPDFTSPTRPDDHAGSRVAYATGARQYPLTLPIWAFCPKYDIDQLGFTLPARLSTDCAGPGQQDPVRLRSEAPRCCTTTAAVCPLQRATDLNARKAGAVLGGRTPDWPIGLGVPSHGRRLLTVVARRLSVALLFRESPLTDVP